MHIKVAGQRPRKVQGRGYAMQSKYQKEIRMNTEHHHAANGSDSLPTKPALAWKGAVIMVAVILGFYVLREHWGHVFGYLPYLILLACPLMHLFMHHGHGHGDREKGDSPEKTHKRTG